MITFDAGLDNNGNGFPNYNITPITSDENCFDTAGRIYYYGEYSLVNYYTLAEVRSTFSKELNSIFGSAPLINAAQGNYKQQPTSPCAGKGVY